MTTTDKTKGQEITKTLLKSISGEFELASIPTLDLSHRDISEPGCIGDCETLYSLNLSHNSLTTLYALSTLSSLTQLDLSNNNIESLEGLQTLLKLHTLNLAGNWLKSVDVLWNISNLDLLWSLTLRTREATNPLFEHCATYRQQVTSILPAINILDGECIRGKDGELFASCEEMEGAVKDIEKYTSHTHTRHGVNSADAWIPEGFWDRSHDAGNDTPFNHMDEKLTELLGSCHRLVEKSDEIYDSVIKSLSHPQAGVHSSQS